MSRAPMTSAETAARPKYTTSYRDRHGKTRWRFKRRGFQCELPGAPGEDRFQEAYAACLAGRRPEGKREDMVYFILAGRRVKIGHSVDPRARLRQLCAGSHAKLKIYYVTPGGNELERDLHCRFADDRINGEWFVYSQKIRGWIADDERRRFGPTGRP